VNGESYDRTHSNSLKFLQNWKFHKLEILMVVSYKKPEFFKAKLSRNSGLSLGSSIGRSPSHPSVEAMGVPLGLPLLLVFLYIIYIYIYIYMYVCI